MYKDYLEDEHFGKLWFTATLRNWNGMGLSVEENLELGPLLEVSLCDFNVGAEGSTLDRAMVNLETALCAYKVAEMDLPPKKPMSRWQRWKLNRLFRKFERDGMTNPVK